ncbi:uncharacterized protein LOC131619177 [Vicia villosa]|uniref:uncharacterized protein LOC131619177 n=1 Tax=Vicia villosa TaxID=3911 RepID=UPI00273BA664|nr:uncharacterized protein LOC131619177 [Vicia villosa]
MKVDGWGMYVLKEKLKLIKGKLKDWHKQHTQNLEGKIKSAKKELNFLEFKGESTTLSSMEIDRKREVYSYLHKFMNINCSIQCQRARIKWLREEDANSNYFHGCINRRMRENDILTLEVNGRMTKEANVIKKEIFTHFQGLFEGRGVRPIPSNMVFQKMEEGDRDRLVQEFSEDKIRRAVWECESSKSPGPDGVNFGFIKDFWETVKGDFFRVLAEFQTYGRMLKEQIVLLSSLSHRRTTRQGFQIIGQYPSLDAYIKLSPKCWQTG